MNPGSTPRSGKPGKSENVGEAALGLEILKKPRENLENRGKKLGKTWKF